MRVVFWGTPDFALPPLGALIGEGFDVVAVVTQPDKPQGRSRSSVVPSPVKSMAQAERIPVLQPAKARDPDFARAFADLDADLSIVVAYGQILPAAVIDAPKMGTLNIHASLLPALRGAGPIQAAILGGLAETGVSIMQMVPALDEGPVLLQLKTPIGPDETFGELQMRLSELGVLALVEALALISLGKAEPRPQDPSQATYAPKITRDSARIDWTKSALEVARVVRACDSKPGAFTTLEGATLKLFGARLADDLRGEPGEVIEVNETLAVACGGEGGIRLSEVQPASKRRMMISDWARGRPLAAGDKLGS